MNASKYAKAYPLEQLREFGGWTEPSTDIELGSYVLLHDTFVVTRGLWVDQDIVFDAVTDEWKNFCTQTLAFDPHQAGVE